MNFRLHITRTAGNRLDQQSFQLWTLLADRLYDLENFKGGSMKGYALITFTLLSTVANAQLAPSSECGISGSIETRIMNCAVNAKSTVVSNTGTVWNLVSRKYDQPSDALYEVWRDSKTGLLWGDFLGWKNYAYPQNLPTFYQAVKLADDGNVIQETACDSKLGKAASAQIQDKNFGLPTYYEFLEAEKNGFREVLPHMHYRPQEPRFWSRTRSPNNPRYGRPWVFDSNDGYAFSVAPDWGAAVRCIGR